MHGASGEKSEGFPRLCFHLLPSNVSFITYCLKRCIYFTCVSTLSLSLDAPEESIGSHYRKCEPPGD